MPITYIQLLVALLQSTGSIAPAVERIIAAIKSGKGNASITDEDWAELARLCNLSSASIYAKEGVTPPPQ